MPGSAPQASTSASGSTDEAWRIRETGVNSRLDPRFKELM